MIWGIKRMKSKIYKRLFSLKYTFLILLLIAGFFQLSNEAFATTTCPNIQNPCSGDADCDNIYDGFDNCPCVKNPDQKDSDVDFLGDVCDQCPNQAGPKSNNGCPVQVCGNGVKEGSEQCDDGNT